MPLAAVVTLIAAAAIVGVLATHLIRIALLLRQISATLDVVIGAVGQIPTKLEPAPPILLGINADLAGAQKLLEDLLAKKLGAAN
jgi:hypothetical protein